MNTEHFIQWCDHFITHVSDLVKDGRMCLLILDGCRSHISVCALEKLRNSKIMVHALPAHTFGKTQPLHVTVFSPFTASLNEAINLAIARDEANNWDTFAFCQMLKFAYQKSFTVQNVRSGFQRARIWPLDASKLLSVPRPKSLTNPGSTVSVAELEELFQKRRRSIRKSLLGSDAKITAKGFVDTTKGEILTSQRAMWLALAWEYQSDKVQKRTGEVRAVEAAARATKRFKKARVDSTRISLKIGLLKPNVSRISVCGKEQSWRGSKYMSLSVRFVH